MNLPERMWRVLRGHIELARERAEADEFATATAELEASIKAAEAAEAALPSPAPRRLPPAAPSRRDPLEPYYRELRLTPGCDLAALDRAYEARLAEVHPELHPPGSPERQSVEAQKAAIVEAYERLRDAINVTETRFEKLELDS